MTELSKLIREDNHKMVDVVSDKKSGLFGFIAIHCGNHTHPSFGATRMWKYNNEDDALLDALRLSKLMSYKAALAGIKCGGAKATLFITDSQKYDKRLMLKTYAERVNCLNGRFVTGADVGISREETIFMRRYSPFMVGVKVDPVRYTGLGISLAIKSCLKEVFGSENYTGRSYAIQGVGKVGQEIIKYIYPYSHNITIADVDEGTIKEMIHKYPDIKVVKPEDIHKQKVDVFSPCALSHTLNKQTIKKMKCTIVAGGANNQLESDDIAEKLYKKSILYAPDYVVNAGGLISVYDEYEYKNTQVKRVTDRVMIIKDNMDKILRKSKKANKNTAKVTDEIAGEIINCLFNK